MTQSQRDRRARRRFNLAIPITITRREAEIEMAKGITRDVSSNGVYFFSDKSYASGERIQFSLTLPPEITLTDPMTLDCIGRVLRADRPEGDNYGVAITIERFHFAA